jgi:hypothetical protein
MMQKAHTNDLAAPEDMFLIWFFGLPDGVDVEGASLSEIAKIDSIATPCDRLLSLRHLLCQATLNVQRQPSRRRQRRGCPQSLH